MGWHCCCARSDASALWFGGIVWARGRKRERGEVEYVASRCSYVRASFPPRIFSSFTLPDVNANDRTRQSELDSAGSKRAAVEEDEGSTKTTICCILHKMNR